MIALKACPRCRGDLHQERDGVFSCLQCGYELNLDDGQQFEAKLEQVKRQVKVAA